MTQIVLPWPAKELLPNARVHFHPKARITRAHHALAFYAATEAGVPRFHDVGPIRLLWTFNPPDKRRRDMDGMISACKAFQDGLAKAWGVDDYRFEPTYRRADPVKGGRVLVEVLA